MVLDHHVFPTEKEFLQNAKEVFLSCVRETLSKEGDCRIALSTSEALVPFYQSLVGEALPWEKLRFIQLHPKGLSVLREVFFKHLPLFHENLLIFDPALNPDSAAKEMDRRCSALALERTPLIDLLVLTPEDISFVPLNNCRQALLCLKGPAQKPFFEKLEHEEALLDPTLDAFFRAIPSKILASFEGRW